MSINNNYYPIVDNVNLSQIPEITKPTMDLFSESVNFDTKNKGLKIQTRIKDLKDLSYSLNRYKKYNVFLKFLSIAWLVTGVVLTTFVAVTFFPIPVSPPGRSPMANVGRAMASIMLAVRNTLYLFPGVVLTGTGVGAIVGSFTRIEREEKYINKKIGSLNKKIEILKDIQKHSPLIRQKIETELKQVDLLQSNSLDYNRINQLRIALRELNTTKIFLEKLNV